MIGFLRQWGIYIVLASFYIIFFIYNKKKQSLIFAKRIALQSENQGKPVFFCQGIELLGTNKANKNIFMLSGDSSGVPVRLGMKVILSGGEYTITEVAKMPLGKEPYLPVSELAAGNYAMLTIESNDLDWKTLKENLKREKVLVFPFVATGKII